MSKISSAKYYHDKNGLVKERNVFLKKKKKKSNKISCKQYKKISEDEKQKLVEYRKKYKIVF